jgi:hypothetical protein
MNKNTSGENMHLPGNITCMVSYPTPEKLTLWEWLGIKNRPPIIPQRLYAAVGSTIFISNVEGKFDYSLPITENKI